MTMGELSPKAMKLILDCEVGGGKSHYDKQLARPTWPGGESGVTIGIGYDLGYTPRARVNADWHMLDQTTLDRLGAAIGVKGRRASVRAKEVRDITIPWETAFEVFQRATVPFWIAQTRSVFPGIDALPWDAAGALVSLVFNRGPSMVGERRAEMRAIRDAVVAHDLPAIAKQLRHMKRLWMGKGLDGLLARREAEAKLVESSK